MDTHYIPNDTYDSLTGLLVRIVEGDRPNALDLPSEVRLALAEAGIFSIRNRELTEAAELDAPLAPAA